MPLSNIVYSNDKETPSILWQCIVVLLSLSVMTVLLLFVDDRTLDGVSVWAKPLKFELSLVIHLATLSVLSSLLGSHYRASKGWQVLCYATVAATLFEILYMLLQAARGRHSHFNQATVIESIMYGLMGLGALTLVVGSAYLGVCLYRRYIQTSDNIVILSAAIGLTIGSFLTLVVAGYMSSGTSHFAKELNEGSATVPLLGWVLGSGDLRISHFFATHAMQFLPLMGFALSKTGLTLSAKKKMVWLFIGIYVLFVVGLFLMALYGY